MLQILAAIIGAAAATILILVLTSGSEEEKQFQMAAAIAACEVASQGIYPCAEIVQAVRDETPGEGQ